MHHQTITNYSQLKKNTTMKAIKNILNPTTIFILSIIFIIAVITIVTIAIGNGKYLLM